VFFGFENLVKVPRGKFHDDRMSVEFSEFFESVIGGGE
jgi:hypothetical protein